MDTLYSLSGTKLNSEVSRASELCKHFHEARALKPVPLFHRSRATSLYFVTFTGSLSTHFPNILNMLGPGWTLRTQRKCVPVPTVTPSQVTVDGGEQSISSDVLRPIDWETRSMGGPPLKGTRPLGGREGVREKQLLSPLLSLQS